MFNTTFEVFFPSFNVLDTFFHSAIGDYQGNRVWAIVLGVLFAIVAISLLIASWTRWGQTKSLTKCIALAFLAHIWLLMYAYGTRIVMPGIGGGTSGGVPQSVSPMTLSLLELATDPTETSQADEPKPLDETLDAITPEEPNLQQENPIEAWQAPLDVVSNPPMAPEVPRVYETLVDRDPNLAQLATLPNVVEPDIPDIDAEEILKLADLPTTPSAESSSAIPMPPSKQSEVVVTRRLDKQPVPMNYQMRMSSMKQQFAYMNGGDENTEAAVERALEWLARSQSPDGSWNAAQYGAGREPPPGNKNMEAEYRHNAGQRANTAMTGLALLAFLGAGHTHVEGRYKENVTAGLRYLLSQQLQSSGDLSGREQVGNEPTVRFARMYSHGMAGLALAEAYAMTGDQQLQPAIAAACQYSMNAMNPNSGGWRYEFWNVNLRTADPGDTSQFGWQAMLLHSGASNQIISLSSEKRMLMNRFLDSVSLGRHGGLASYRPKMNNQSMNIDSATPSMTAEALASRLLMRFPLNPQAADEASRYLLKQLPGHSEENLYYWYYATLAFYQLKGASTENAIATPQQQAWNIWNDALKKQLCATQLTQGNMQGSWHPTCVWGNYGGRVYSTAVACMCLEVYYRYLPIYQPDQYANQWQPARR